MFNIQVLASLGCLMLLAHSTFAQLTLTSKGCVNPSEFNTCYNAVIQNAEYCISNFCTSGSCSSPESCSSSDSHCYPACISVAYQGFLNCAIASCWNRAYSCEFQQLQITAILQSIEYLTVLFPPYFPAPSNVPGACSCRMGLAYGEIQQWLSDTVQCENTVNNGGYGGADFEYCSCCGASKAESALRAICPATAPSSLPFLSQSGAWANAQSTFTSSDCKTTYNPTKVNCSAAPFDFAVYGRTFYGPQNLPAPGTKSVYNSAGALAKPTQATIVWSLASGLVPSTAIAAKSTKSKSKTTSVPTPTAVNINLYSNKNCQSALGGCTDIPDFNCCYDPNANFSSASATGLKNNDILGVFNNGQCGHLTNERKGNGCVNGLNGKQSGSAWEPKSGDRATIEGFECKERRLIDTVFIAGRSFEFGEHLPQKDATELLDLATRGASEKEIGKHLKIWQKL